MFNLLMLRRLLGTLTAAYGLALAVPGAMLVAAGGTPAFLLAGLGTAASGALIALRRDWGLLLYFIVFAGTVLWAFGEVGFDWVQLAPRLLIAAVLALGLAVLAAIERAETNSA